MSAHEPTSAHARQMHVHRIEQRGVLRNSKVERNSPRAEWARTDAGDDAEVEEAPLGALEQQDHVVRLHAQAAVEVRARFRLNRAPDVHSRKARLEVRVTLHSS